MITGIGGYPLRGPLGDVIARAGAANSFFWAADWPRVLPHDVGLAAMDNVVAGGLATPTAPAGSAQPVWEGQYVDFLGDDELNGTFSPVVGTRPVTIGVVARADVTGNFNRLIVIGTGSDEISINESDNLRAEAQSANGTRATKAIGIDPSLAFSVVLTLSPTAGTLRITGRSSQNTDALADTGIGFDTFSLSTLRIGEGRDRFWTGPYASIFVSIGTYPTDTQADALRDQLFYQYAPLLE